MEKLVESLGITRLSQVAGLARWPRTSTRRSRRSAPGRWTPGPYTFVAADALVLKVREGGRVGQRARPARDRGQRRRAPGDPRPAGHLRRGRRRLAGVLPRPDRPRPDRGRSWSPPTRTRGLVDGDRRDPARRRLAAVPHPLRREPDVGHPEERLGRGSRRCCTRSTTSPTPTPCTPSSTGSSTPWPTSCPRSPSTSTPPAPTSWPSPRSPRRSGARSGPTTPTNGSTGRSAAAPTSSASSPTATPLIRLVGAVLAEQHDEWTEGRRYLGLDVLAKSRLTTSPTPTPPPTEEVTITAITA